MMTERFSLRSMLLLVAFISASLAALVGANALLADVVVSLTVGLLIVAAVVAVSLPGSSPFWRAFSLAGWSYFLLAMCVAGVPIAEHLPTTQLLDRAFTVLFPSSVEQPFTRPYVILGPPYLIGGTTTRLHSIYFLRIGQCLFALAVGMVGGLLGEWLGLRRRMPGEAQQ